MDGFGQYLNKFAAAIFLLLGGCTSDAPILEGPTSLRVTIVSPTNLGSDDDRLLDSARDVVFNVEVLGADGQRVSDFSAELDLFAHFLNGLSPDDGFPLIRVNVSGGVAENVAVTLPPVFGPVYLWVEDTQGENPTYVTGTSEKMWFREPYLEDISRPVDEMALNALSASPLEDKQIVIAETRHGTNGRLMVTGTYAQGYTLSDVDCSASPCTVGDYDSIYVYSFSRAENENGEVLQPGDVVTAVSGSISEFNGLTEVSFPDTIQGNTTSLPGEIPEPVVIQESWLSSKIEMERNESSLVAIDNATVCDLDEDFERYSQWKLDVGQGCGNPINIITSGQVPLFVPEDFVGETLPRVVGTLRPVNIGSFNVWIVYPRFLEDIQTQ